MIIFGIVIVTGLFWIAIHGQRRITESTFNGVMSVWADELAKSLFEQDWLSVARIGKTITQDRFISVQIVKSGNQVFSYPNESGVEDCKAPLSYSLMRYGVSLGEVRVCSSLKQQVWRAATSVFFLTSVFTSLFILLLSSFGPLYAYRRSLLAMMDRLAEQKPNLIDSSDDLLTKRIMTLVTDFVSKQVSLQKQIDDLEAGRALGEVAAQVSHDIRSPLSAIRMAIQGMESNSKERQQLIMSATQRINDIAQDLLILHKKTQSHSPSTQALPGKVEIQKEPITIKPLLDEIFREKRTAYMQHPFAKLNFDFSGPPSAMVLLDRKEILRTISNLLNNAIESLEAPGTVTLALRSGTREVAILISDSGKGIPPDLMDRLGRERISQGKESSESGSGIGVLHAAKTVESLGGRFQIQSRIGHGTMVTLLFPRHDLPEQTGYQQANRRKSEFTTRNSVQDSRTNAQILGYLNERNSPL